MNSLFCKVFKYELLNILRNRWVFFYLLLVGAITFSLIHFIADPQKVLVTLSSLTVVLVPLITTLFSSLYWYYNERFTQILLTQPLARSTLYKARICALIGALSLSFIVGSSIIFLIFAEMSYGFLLLIFIATLLTCIFVSIAIATSSFFNDRMKGMGIVLGLWLYFVLIHDALTLGLLISLREYPMDIPAALLGTINPIGLARVVLMMYNESALLLGHTGALTRLLLTRWQGFAGALLIAAFWLCGPTLLGYFYFKKRDF